MSRGLMKTRKRRKNDAYVQVTEDAKSHLSILWLANCGRQRAKPLWHECMVLLRLYSSGDAHIGNDLLCKTAVLNVRELVTKRRYAAVGEAVVV